MKVYQEEIQAFEKHSAQKPWEDLHLSAGQYRRIMHRGRSLQQWTQKNTQWHNIINFALLLALLATNIGGLYAVSTYGTQWPVLAWISASLFHGWISYSVIIYTVHEGAAHDRAILPRGPISRLGAFLLNNASRLFFADPLHYKENHIKHHKFFGTHEDGSFTNFILPKRFLKSLIPGAGFLDFNDFRVHMGTEWSSSRVVSVLTGILYATGLYFVLGWGLLAFLGFMLVSSSFAFGLDRLRESFEHNLMPADNKTGSRSLGMNFWGLLIGGGPWGQPCHYMHHLYASLAWYGQIKLHFYTASVLSSEQKKEIMLEGFWDFPLRFISMLRKNKALTA